MESFLSRRVVQVAVGCFDLGCWTICNGTGWPKTYPLPPPPPFPDLSGLFYLTVLSLALSLLLLLCLYTYSTHEDHPHHHPTCGLPNGDLPPGDKPDKKSDSSEDEPPIPPPAPSTPTRGNITAKVQVHLQNGDIRSRDMRVAICTPLSTIKEGLPRSAFPDLHLEDDLPRCRLFYGDQDEELDEQKTLKENQCDKDGIILKLKMTGT